MPQQQICLYSNTEKVDQGEKVKGAKWKHDGKCKTLPYYDERTKGSCGGPAKRPKWQLKTFSSENKQCKEICTGTTPVGSAPPISHCCIATCILSGNENTCKLNALAPEWYLSRDALAVNKEYIKYKGWTIPYPPPRPLKHHDGRATYALYSGPTRKQGASGGK